MHFIPILLHTIYVYVDYACYSHTLMLFFCRILYISSHFPCVILVGKHVAYPPILPCVILWNTSKHIHRLLPHSCGERAQNACASGG